MALQAPQIDPTRNPEAYQRWFSDPVERLQNFQSQELKYKIAYRVSLVAIAAIAVAVITFSFVTAAASGGAVPYLVLGMTIVTPFLQLGASHFQAKQLYFQKAAEFEQLVVEEDSNLERGVPDDNEVTLLEHKITNFLRTQMNYAPDERIRHVFARVMAIHNYIVRERERQMNPAGNIPNVLSRDALVRHCVDKTRKMWINANDILVRGLQGALGFHILQHPNEYGSLDELGELSIHSFEEQYALLTCGQPNEFFSKQGKEALTREDLENCVTEQGGFNPIPKIHALLVQKGFLPSNPQLALIPEEADPDDLP